MNEQLESRLRFLREAHTETMPHTQRALFDHLLSTRQLLVELGARPALCDAGLFHSIYSTEHYEQQAFPLSRRDEVQQLIGDEAESLVWLFCMMRRETLLENPGQDQNRSVEHRLTGEQIPLSTAQYRDLITLTLANSLEAFHTCSWYWRRILRSTLRSYRRLAIPEIQKAIERYHVRWWEIWK